jgi:hypothetical protein
MTKSGFKAVFLLLVFAVVPVLFCANVLEPLPDTTWSQKIHAGIYTLLDKRPPDVPLGEWEFMIGWTINLHANYGHSWYWVNRERRYHFLREFERRLQAPVDAATIDWIWDEFAQHTKGGQDYSDKYRPTRSPDLKRAQPGWFSFPKR